MLADCAIAQNIVTKKHQPCHRSKRHAGRSGWADDHQTLGREAALYTPRALFLSGSSSQPEQPARASDISP